MKAKGVTKAAMIGNNNFNFEKESFGAFRLGLDQVDPSYEWTYVATGSFNDVAAATEAFNNLKAQGVGAIYPYLGGSHEAVVKLSNENDVITMSAGAANACERTDLDYQMAVKFDAGQYVATILDEIQSGELQRGETRVFHVGVDDSVGAVDLRADRGAGDADGGHAGEDRRRRLHGRVQQEPRRRRTPLERSGTGAAPVDGAAPRSNARSLEDSLGSHSSEPGVAAVRLDGISKRYGRVVACDGVDMTLQRGRVHGVLGENGAGKSTLMKILIGLVQPDAGSIAVHGERKVIADPLAAADLGIAMVHQHYSLVEPLTVWENVILGERVRLDRSAACERVAAISARYGLGVDPLATVSRLTAGQRQRVEIIKCLRREPEIIVFDEPTSVLTPAESEQLFTVLRAVVAEEHRAVALVSHKLDEILHATDEVTIMRGGRVVDRVATSTATASSLAQSMVGRPVSLRSEAAALGLIETVAEVASDEHADACR